MKRAGATKSLFLISDRSNPIHASVGVIIAIVANTWAGRIVPPFIWGFIWCARLALLPSDLPRGRRHKLTTFYAAQYVRAVIGSLVPALAIGSVLFGLSHFNKRSTHFNWQYVLLATIAGIFYGRAWRENRRVAASAITHTWVDWLWSWWF